MLHDGRSDDMMRKMKPNTSECSQHFNEILQICWMFLKVIDQLIFWKMTDSSCYNISEQFYRRSLTTMDEKTAYYQASGAGRNNPNPSLNRREVSV